MTSYVLLNGTVTLFVGAIALFCCRNRRWWQRVALATLALLVLTAVFDPLIIAARIVAYHRDLTLGINIFGAPIEDFAYALVAGMLVPLLWKWYEKI